MVKVAVELPDSAASAGEWLADAQAMEAAGAAALLVPEDAEGRDALLGALAAVTATAAVDGRAAPPAVRWLARGRVLESEAVAAWRRVPVPRGRDHWRELHAEAEADGLEGIVVPLCPPLLDLLRNPDIDEDRSDLRLAQG